MRGGECSASSQSWREGAIGPGGGQGKENIRAHPKRRGKNMTISVRALLSGNVGKPSTLRRGEDYTLH